MIHAMFWLLLITCYLLLATCYLTPVTCYLLVSTCYFLLNLFLLIWSWVFWSLLVLANRFLPFTTVVRLALVIIQFLLFSSVCLLVVARTLRPDWRKVGHPSNLNQSRIYGWQQYFGQTSRQGGIKFEISWEPNFPVNNFARTNGKNPVIIKTIINIKL